MATPSEQPVRLGAAWSALRLDEAAAPFAHLFAAHEAEARGSGDPAALAHDDDLDIHGNHDDVANVERSARDTGNHIRSLETYSRVQGEEAQALKSVQHNEFATGEGGDKGGGAQSRRQREQAFRNAMQALNDHIAMLDGQIRELGRRADAIEDYLNGPIEVGADGRLTNDQMERELQEYERRTGQRIDRSNEEAVRAALREQQEFILRERDGLIRERDRAQDFADRVAASGEPPTVEQMRMIIPDYTAGELDRGSATMDAARAAVIDEARGYDADQRDMLADGRDNYWDVTPESRIEESLVEPLSLDGLEPTTGTAVADVAPTAEGDGVPGPISLEGLGDEGSAPIATEGSPSAPEPITVAAQIDGSSLSPIELTGLFAECVTADGGSTAPAPDATCDNTLAADTVVTDAFRLT